MEKLSKNQKQQIWHPKCPKTYPEPKMAPKIGKCGQIWLKCIIEDLIMMIRDKNNNNNRLGFDKHQDWFYR